MGLLTDRKVAAAMARCHAHGNAPDTRREAHAKARSELLQQQCLAAIKQCDRTADEVAGYIGETVLSTRPRITELFKAGKIVKTPYRRKNTSGRSAVVWALAA